MNWKLVRFNNRHIQVQVFAFNFKLLYSENCEFQRLSESLKNSYLCSSSHTLFTLKCQITSFQADSILCPQTDVGFFFLKF